MKPIDYGIFICAAITITAILRLAYLACTEPDNSQSLSYPKEIEIKMNVAWEWTIAGSIMLFITSLIKVIVEMM